MGLGAPAYSFMSLLNEDRYFQNMESVMELGAQEINRHFISMLLDFPFN